MRRVRLGLGGSRGGAALRPLSASAHGHRQATPEIGRAIVTCRAHVILRRGDAEGSQNAGLSPLRSFTALTPVQDDVIGAAAEVAFFRKG